MVTGSLSYATACLFTVCLSVSVAEIGYRWMSGLSVSMGMGKVARLKAVHRYLGIM
jgi:hypothetical protein